MSTYVVYLHNCWTRAIACGVPQQEQELTQMTQVEADDNITRDTIMSIMWYARRPPAPGRMSFAPRARDLSRALSVPLPSARMDVNRTKFLLRAYLRTRLLKVLVQSVVV